MHATKYLAEMRPSHVKFTANVAEGRNDAWERVRGWCAILQIRHVTPCSTVPVGV